MIFVFGADIKTAGTASVLISNPLVLYGRCAHWLTGHYRSQSMLAYLVFTRSCSERTSSALRSPLRNWKSTGSSPICQDARGRKDDRPKRATEHRWTN